MMPIYYVYLSHIIISRKEFEYFFILFFCNRKESKFNKYIAKKCADLMEFALIFLTKNVSLSNQKIFIFRHELIFQHTEC